MTLVIRNLPANGGNTRGKDLIPGSGRSPGEGNGYPLQYSCLENSTDREAYSPWDHKESDMTEHEGTRHQVGEQGRATERAELWAPGFHYTF